MATKKKEKTKATSKSSSKKSTKKTSKKTSKKSSKKSKKSKKEEEKPEFNPREHALVPKHEVLNEKEIQELFEHYDIQPTSIPTIYSEDPALKGLEVKMGDIIRITRPSLTAKQAVFYRRVSYE